MMIDEDGLTRVNLTWKIEGRRGQVRSGEYFELHEQEVASAKAAIRRAARRGDTVTISVD